MDKREAMRRAHKIVALFIQQALDSNPDDWTGNEADQERINDCIIEIRDRHERDAGATG